MFSFSKMSKLKKFLYTGLFFSLLVVALGACSTEAEDDTNYEGALPDGLVGKWVSGIGDSFEITRASGVETIIYDDGGFGFGYTGTVRFVSNFDSRSGVIIIQYVTGASDASKPYHAVFYLNFAGSTVELNNSSDATREDWNADTASLAEAKEKFTRGKMGDYMDLSYSTPYTKEN